MSLDTLDTRAASGCTVLAVTGMTCPACVRVVTTALSRVSGATKVNVDHGAARAFVEGTADPAALVAAVEKAGYGARLA